MGKKLQGAKLRAQKRARAIARSMNETQVVEVLDAAFTIDRTGDSQMAPHLLPDKEVVRVSNYELQVQKLKRKHSQKKLKRMADESRKKLQQQQRPQPHSTSATNTERDLWGEEDNTTPATKTKLNKRSKASPIVAGIAPAHVTIKGQTFQPPPHKQKDQPSVAVQVAQPGQSYKPDATQHKHLLQQATKLEMKRQDKIQYDNTPISNGLLPETKAILLDEDQEHSDNDDDKADTILANEKLGNEKRPQKLTKAQRNKQKRQRLVAFQEQKERREKKFLKSLGQVGAINKQLNNKSAIKPTEQKSKLGVPKGENLISKQFDREPVNAPTMPVALEVAPGLRTIVPHGSLIEDRILSMADRQQIPHFDKDHTSERRRKISSKPAKKSVKGKKNSGAHGPNFKLLG